MMRSRPMIYTHHTSSGTVYLGIWVDDIILVGMINEINKVKAALRKKFKMTDLGDASFLLGISIIHDRSTCTIHLSQEAYIQTILERFGISECKPVRTPMETSVRLKKSDTPDENDKDIPY